MLSITKTVLLTSIALIFCIGLTSNYATIRAEEDEPETNENIISAPLLYGDDWTVLSSINTPDPVITQINNNYIPLPNPQSNYGFRCNAEHDRARLDVDGDSEFDTDLRNRENFITYRIEYPSTFQMDYKMRVFYQGSTSSGRKNWQFQRACYVTAKTPLETFTLIDDNNNGYFNDYGRDAIVIGRTEKVAVPLSSVIAIKKKFYRLSVNMLEDIPEDAKKIRNFTPMVLTLEPFEGDTGKIDLIKKLTPPKDKPSVIIIKGENDMYFRMDDKPAEIPVGEYYLLSAVFGKRCRARSSEKPLAIVEKDKVATPEWGGPFKLKISPYCDQGGEVTLVTPPGLYKAPEYARQYIECPFIKMNFPTVVGVLGEEYYSPDEFKDDRGFAFPDGGVFGFKVEILPKDAPPKTKPINKTVANPFCADWIPVDLSGLVQKAPPFLEDYRCPIKEYRGIVVVKVWANARMFGGEIMGEKEVEITEEQK